MNNETGINRPYGSKLWSGEPFVGRATELATLVELLRGLHRTSSIALVDGEAGIGKTFLLRRFDQEASRLGIQARWDWREACAEIIGESAPIRAEPTLILADDLHAASSSGLEALRMVLRPSAGTSVVVIGAYRKDGGSAGRPFGQFLARLAHDQTVIRLSLRGFALNEVEQYLGAMHGTGSPKSEVSAIIHGRTGGNPFLVREMASLLRASPESDAIALVSTVPDGVIDVVQSRLYYLQARTREVLTYAALADGHLEVELISRLTGLEGRPLLDCLSEAERMGFLTRAPGGSYAFPHQLTRDAILASLTNAERLSMHLRFAIALESLDPSRSAELARHYGLATTLHPAYRVTAALHSHRAARDASAAGRWEEAATAYDAAAELLGPGETEGVDLDRLTCLIAAGSCWSRADRQRDAWHSWMRAADECRHRGEPLRLADVLLLALSNIDVPRPRRLRLADEALEIVRAAGATDLVARVLVVRAAEDDTPAGERDADEALEIAQKLGLQDVLLRIVRRRLVHAMGHGEFEQARLLLRRAQTASDSADAEVTAEQLFREAELYVRAGELSAAEPAVDEAISYATRHRIIPVVVRGRRFLAAIALAKGDLATFDALARALPDRPIERQLLVRRAELSGEYAKARTLVPEDGAPGADHPRVAWDLAATRARIAFLAGEESIASGHLTRWARTYGTQYHPLDPHDGLAAAAEALVALSDVGMARPVYVASSTYPRVVFSPLVATGLDRLRGLLAMRLGNQGEAERWFGRALEWSATHRLTAELALVELAWAELFTATVRNAKALDTTLKALERSQGHQLHGIAGRAQQLLSSLQIPPGERAGASDVRGLTEREKEVLNLVANGRTNQQIASDLRISRHTANRHLSNILGKLEAANRAEAVRRAVEMGLLEDALPRT